MSQSIYIGTNTAFANSITNNWNAAMRRVQQTLDIYLVIGLAALTAVDFPRLFSSPKELLYDKLVGIDGSANFYNTGQGDHIEVDKVAAFTIIKKPFGITALLDDIARLDEDVTKGWQQGLVGVKTKFHLSGITTYFTLDEAGNLCFTPEHSARIAEYGKVYLTTEKGQAHYRFVRAFQDAFFESGLDKYYPPANGQLTPHSVELMEQLVKHFTVNPNFQTRTFNVNPLTYSKLDNPALSGQYLQ